MKTPVPIGMLFSSAGPYQTVSRAMRDGALLALEEVNADSRFNFELKPYWHDPKGSTSAYLNCARKLLRDDRVQHVVGCYTSSSRKEIIPCFEKYDALLWYPSHYEGFETSDNVIYTGAAPNHHILTLMDFVIRNVGRKIFCIGSNYIWAWENIRVVRELMLENDGCIIGERFLQVGDCDVSRIIDEIIDCRPAFVLNMLIGESSYAFYRAFAEASRMHQGLRGTLIGSCTLCEPELAEIGSEACAGHLSSSAYFATVQSAANWTFREAYSRRFGPSATPSADAEASYDAIHLLARALVRSDPSDIDLVKSTLYEVEFQAPQGWISVDRENNHSFLTPRLGVSQSDGTFEIIWEAREPARPDPYLVWVEPSGVGKPNRSHRQPPKSRPTLRVIG